MLKEHQKVNNSRLWLPLIFFILFFIILVFFFFLMRSKEKIFMQAKIQLQRRFFSTRKNQMFNRTQVDKVDNQRNFYRDLCKSEWEVNLGRSKATVTFVKRGLTPRK